MMFLGIGSSVVVVMDLLITNLPSYVLAAAAWWALAQRGCTLPSKILFSQQLEIASWAHI
jgi:hypothetical protein